MFQEATSGMLHVSLLGEQAISGEGAGVRASSSRAVALVAFLVVHAGSPQPRQRIAGLFWPESPDGQALTNLRRELHQLRQVLGGEPSLQVTSRDLCWQDSSSCCVDVRAFDSACDAALAAAAAGDDQASTEHAQLAVTLYRGDFLPGTYDDWVLEARSGLERRCVAMCDLLRDALARSGDLAGAAQAARRRIGLQPLEEIGYRTLMLLQADMGDRAGAISTYHHCASVLERELGVTPDPATQRAFQRLMARAAPARTSSTGAPSAGFRPAGKQDTGAEPAETEPPELAAAGPRPAGTGPGETEQPITGPTATGAASTAPAMTGRSGTGRSGTRLTGTALTGTALTGTGGPGTAAGPAGATRAAAEPAGNSTLGRVPLGAATLIGRSAELGVLRSAWQAAATGSAGVTVVRGGAGVGKTRLVSELAGIARLHGAAVASTHCFGAHERLALAPVADWLRSPALQPAASRLAEPWRAEFGRLVPASGARPASAPPQLTMADAWQRHRFFEGLARGLTATGRPVLLVLDNMQWSDQETLAFLSFCLGLLPEAPLLVAGTLRDEEAGEDPEIASWIARTRSAGQLTELSLGPLEAADTARLAAAITGRELAAADAALLQAATGGFPLYAIEAMRGSTGHGSTAPESAAQDSAAQDGAGPSSARPGSAAPAGRMPPAGDLTGVLRGRLAQLTGPARDVACLAAAVGTDFSLSLLTEASDLDEGVVVEAVDELWRRRIVHELGDGYDFTHDLLRETAYQLLSPPRRWLLHRRVAQAMELLNAHDTDAVAVRLAGQYSRGGRPDRAVTYYRRAADLAAGMFAHAEAIRLHREALTLISSLPAGRDRDRRELAVCEAMAAPLNARYGYSSRQLQRTLERSITLAESLGSRDSTLTGLVALMASRFVQGRTADSYRMARRALDLAGPESELSGPAHFAVGGSALSLGRPSEAVHHLRIASRLSSAAVVLSVGTRPDVHSAAWAAHAHWLLGDAAQAASSGADAIELASSTGQPYHLAVALAYRAVTYQFSGTVEELRDCVAKLRALCERYDFAYYREWGQILDGWCRGGEAGIELARHGIGNLRSEGALARMPYWLSLLADLLTRAGQRDAGRATLDAALTAAQAHDDRWWLPEVMRMRAGYDDPAAAAVRLHSAAQLAAEHGSVALLRRCELDLARRDGSRRRDRVPPGS
jgi:DNA-binding SARP family transcriptional activator